MAFPDSRLRLGLYGVVLAALITAAVIALFSIGGDDNSMAARRTPADRLGAAALPGTPAPSSTPTRPAGPATSAVSAPTTSAPATGSGRASTSPARRDPHPAQRLARTKAKVYTVRRGDNLTVIARWFDLHGYQPLYAWNKTVIGRNPNLIFPGQKIIVVPGGTVSVQQNRP